MTPEEVQRLIEAGTAPLLAEIARLRNDLNLYRTNGLDALRTRSLAFHNVPYVTTVPTASDKPGSPRLVQTATGPNTYAIYFYTPDGWQSVALS